MGTGESLNAIKPFYGEQAVVCLAGDHAASIAAHDQIHLQALEMAYMLSDGIVRQYPKQFT